VLVKYLNSSNYRKGMLNKNVLCGFLFLVLLLNFSSALDDLGTKQVGEEFMFCQVCSDATYITLSSVETPNSTEIINANMTHEGSGQYCYNYTASQVGRHDFRGISDGCENTFATYVYVNLSGVQNTTTLIIADIFIILSLSLLIFILHSKYKNVSKNDSTRKITESHNGNWSKTFIKTLGDNLMRNSFLWYYSLGWLLLIVFRDLVYNFNGLEIYNFFVLFVDIYSFGFILVIVVWIGILMRHFGIISDIISDLNKGIER